MPIPQCFEEKSSNIRDRATDSYLILTDLTSSKLGVLSIDRTETLYVGDMVLAVHQSNPKRVLLSRCHKTAASPALTPCVNNAEARPTSEFEILGYVSGASFPAIRGGIPLHLPSALVVRP